MTLAAINGPAAAWTPPPTGPRARFIPGLPIDLDLELSLASPTRKMEISEADIASTPPAPWTPRSSGFSALSDAEGSYVDHLLHTGNLPGSPMKYDENYDGSVAPRGAKRSPNPVLNTPQRLTKRIKAPASPAAAMLLHAAETIDSPQRPHITPVKRLAVMDGFGNSLSPGIQDSTDLFDGGILAPPSPAVTPSRLLFSPAETMSSQRIKHDAVPPAMPVTISPFTGMYVESLDEDSSPETDVGSIWKQEPNSPPRTKSDTTNARRPLLELMTPSSANRGDDSSENEDPEPLPSATPISAQAENRAERKPKQHPSHLKPQLLATPRSSGTKKKDRKTYSTAGRPRVRGEYKCGKCGFMPKKAKHDCEEHKESMVARGEELPGRKQGGRDGSPDGRGSNEMSMDMSPLANPTF